MEKTRKRFSPLSDSEEAFLAAFDQKIRFEARVNTAFFAVILLEFVSMLFLLPFLIQSALLAFILAIFVLTLFGFFLLRQYFNSEKKIYFESLVKELIREGKDKRSEQLHEPEHHVEVAEICTRLADKLYQREYRYYTLPSRLFFFRFFGETLSAWLHWRDVHLIRELLLQGAIDEYLALVRKAPTDPDVHALLANAYVLLSALYLDPKKIYPDDVRWISKERSGDRMQEEFRKIAGKAVEEFKILKEYAPNDPWIYTQLAYSYRDLQMQSEEKNAYEAILMLRPNDSEIRFKLGSLYLQSGENAKGLKIYEDLKMAHFNKADELLSLYGKGGKQI